MEICIILIFQHFIFNNSLQLKLFYHNLNWILFKL